MSNISGPAPAGLSRCAYVIDFLVCEKLHNPIISSLIVSGILVSVAARQYVAWTPYNPPGETGFFLDLLQHAMNLLFIFRFPRKSKKTLRITSGKITEMVLLMCLNVVAMVSLSSPFPFSSLMDQAFCILLWVSIMCPYSILFSNLAEYAWARVTQQKKKSNVAGAPSRKEGILSIMIDANNSFMAIFIAQSFTAINLDLPFLGNSVLSLVYRYSCYSMKFYLIYCFVLYEVVVMIYDIDDIKSYTELYRPVQLGLKKSTWSDWFENITPICLLVTTIFAMLFDCTMMWFEYSYSHY